MLSKPVVAFPRSLWKARQMIGLRSGSGQRLLENMTSSGGRNHWTPFLGSCMKRVSDKLIGNGGGRSTNGGSEVAVPMSRGIFCICFPILPRCKRGGNWSAIRFFGISMKNRRAFHLMNFLQEWEYLGESFDYEFLAGFVGMRQLEDLTLRPEIGWVVRPASTDSN